MMAIQPHSNELWYLYAQTVVRADYYASEELFSESHQIAQFNKTVLPPYDTEDAAG